jgi:chromosome segregation ATPase
MSTPTLIDDDDREWRDQLAALQAQSDARFEVMQTKSDARFEAMQARSDARFEAMQLKIDARFDALHSELRTMRCELQDTRSELNALRDDTHARFAAVDAQIIKIHVTLATMQEQMMTRNEFHAFLDNRFEPLARELVRTETRITRMTIGLIMGALILFSGLVFQSQRSFEHALTAHTAQAHSGQNRP